jgi:hypothetical protein
MGKVNIDLTFKRASSYDYYLAIHHEATGGFLLSRLV